MYKLIEMKPLLTLWRFARPHTIIGSVVSVSTLYFLTCDPHQRMHHLPLLLLSLVTGISCNIFIVGVNQIADIAIDKINKPFLPLASGALKIKEAYAIVYASALICTVCAAYVSFVLLGIVSLSMLIGMAYSLPPFNFKKHHLPAAMAITVVRGLLVNLGGYYVFSMQLHGTVIFSNEILMLSFFIVIFTIGIAWFKDLPDMAGDEKYNIRTFALVHSPKTVFFCGTVLVGLAYLVTIIFYRYFNNSPDVTTFIRSTILEKGHLILLILFLLSSALVRLDSQVSVKSFYKRFWLFFFAEYLLYMTAYL